MRKYDDEKLYLLERFIHNYAQKNNGDIPTLSVIMKYMAMAKTTAYRYMLRLKTEDKIEYSGKGTMQLKRNTSATQKYRSIKVPIFGSIVCGSPEEEEQYNEGYLAIPVEWIDEEAFLLRAKGDSMIDAGISEGDLVLVKKTKDKPRNNQIVVALTENGNTLKRFGYIGKQPALFAVNKDYPQEKLTIFPKTLEIQGIVTKIIKNVD